MSTTLKFENRRTKIKLCPCGKSNKDGKFAPFEGHKNRGYCFSCVKTFFPDDGTLTAGNSLMQQYRPSKPIEPSYHDLAFQDEIMEKYASQPKNCNLTTFLLKKFSYGEVAKMLQAYFITGVDKPWKGSTVFWQIDGRERIHGGKIMLYDPDTGKRIKEPYQHFSWLHKTLNLTGFNLNQCLFGLHRAIERPFASLGVVESEKTAIMMSALVPEIVWLATGGKDNLKSGMMNEIRGRQLLLYPDKGEFSLWHQIAHNLKKEGHKIGVSRIIEDTNLEKGSDLADYYLAQIR